MSSATKTSKSVKTREETSEETAAVRVEYGTVYFKGASGMHREVTLGGIDLGEQQCLPSNTTREHNTALHKRAPGLAAR